MKESLEFYVQKLFIFCSLNLFIDVFQGISYKL